MTSPDAEPDPVVEIMELAVKLPTKDLRAVGEWAVEHAKMLERRKSDPAPVREPLLGYATTRLLLEELTARIEVSGDLDYRTVDCDGENESVLDMQREVRPEEVEAVSEEPPGERDAPAPEREPSESLRDVVLKTIPRFDFYAEDGHQGMQHTPGGEWVCFKHVDNRLRAALAAELEGGGDGE